MTHYDSIARAKGGAALRKKLVRREPMTIHRVSFPGAILERGFWLYVWRISCGSKEFYYVGRTGDSSSQFASSPFSRLGQHLDIRPNANANTLLRHVRSQGLDPLDCAFELQAYGPLFPEQPTLDLHRKYRDQIAPLETVLAELIKEMGFNVVGVHGKPRCAPEELRREVERVFQEAFNVPAR